MEPRAGEKRERAVWHVVERTGVESTLGTNGVYRTPRAGWSTAVRRGMRDHPAIERRVSRTRRREPL
jgi:hypothetical protein